MGRGGGGLRSGGVESNCEKLRENCDTVSNRSTNGTERSKSERWLRTTSVGTWDGQVRKTAGKLQKIAINCGKLRNCGPPSPHPLRCGKDSDDEELAMQRHARCHGRTGTCCGSWRTDFGTWRGPSSPQPSKVRRGVWGQEHMAPESIQCHCTRVAYAPARSLLWQKSPSQEKLGRAT